jgi:hypothetical protein
LAAEAADRARIYPVEDPATYIRRLKRRSM